MMRNKVLVYKPDLLPYSETFIKEQVLAYQRWQGVLVGHRRVPNGLPLNGLDVRLLLNDPPGRIEELRWRLRRWLGLVSRAEVHRLAAENAQLFHAHFGTVAVDIWPLVRALGLPMVVTLHGFDINIHREWWGAGHGGLRMRSYPRKLLALAQEPRVHFIAVSEAIRQRAIEYGIPADKVTVCYIGVDTQRFKPGGLPITQRARRVLFVGRLVEKKGVTYLIEAFAKVAQHIPDAELVIIGDGPLRAKLEEQARSVKCCINFLGALTSDQVKQQMNEARVFCLPSITSENGDAEGFGIVILEAQASGVPVVTSSVGAENVGLLDGKTGYFFREGNVNVLEKNIRSLLFDDMEAQIMSKTTRNFILENFSISHHANLLESHYYEIIDRVKNNVESFYSSEKIRFTHRRKEIEIIGYSDEDHIYKIIKSSKVFYEIDLLEYIRLIYIFIRKKNGIVFDIGSNIGNHAIYFYKYLTKNVICFEPNPLVIPTLKNNFILNGCDIQTYELALGEKEEFATIFLPKESNIGAAKLVKALDSDVKIQVMRLDDMWINIAKETDKFIPSIIKADIEGMESEMLRGAINLISLYRPHLFLEASDGAALHKIETILFPLGYKKVASFASTPVYHFSPKGEYFTSKILSLFSKAIFLFGKSIRKLKLLIKVR